MEGLVICLLTAMSLLASLGLRYPVQMLPILPFEVTWKVIGIAAVAIPHLIAQDMNAATRRVLFSCSFVVILDRCHPVGLRLEALRQKPRGPLGLASGRCPNRKGES